MQIGKSTREECSNNLKFGNRPGISLRHRKAQKTCIEMTADLFLASSRATKNRLRSSLSPTMDLVENTQDMILFPVRTALAAAKSMRISTAVVL
jgi:hypothetical protein